MTHPTAPPQAAPAKTQALLDMEMFAGCYGMTVDRIAGVVEAVQIGDQLVIDPNGVPKAGRTLLISVSGPPFLAKCRMYRGRLVAAGYGITDFECRVLGVVRGLVRVL